MKRELAYNHILYSARNDLHEYGVFSDHTGVGCTKVFNKQIDWGYNFPFCTTRPLGIRTAWEEMKIFLSGNQIQHHYQRKVSHSGKVILQ